MSHPSITELVHSLDTLEISALRTADARRALAAVSRTMNWAVALRATLLRRLDDLAAEQGSARHGPPGAEGSEPGDRSGQPTSAGPGDGSGQPTSAEQSSSGDDFKPSELELAEAARMSEREAVRQVGLAKLLGRLPEFAAALRRSIVAESHLQVLGRLWAQFELEDRHRLMELDARLVQLAAANDPERFRRVVSAEVNRRRERDGVDRLSKQRRATGLTHWVDDAGMVNLRARFDPERGQRLLNRIRIRRDEIIATRAEPDDCPAGDLRWEHLSAVALFDLTGARAAAASANDWAAGPWANDTSMGAGADAGAGARAPAGGTGPWVGGSGDPSRMFVQPDAEIVVVVDEASLRSGLHPESRLDAGPVDLPLATIRRLACDAGVIPVVLGGDGVALDVGRSRRLATHAQRRALRVMYTTCAVPGCDVGFDACRPHHLAPWAGGGGTDLANLVPLCSRHHHAAHEGGWQLVMEPRSRVLTITRPDGAVLVGVPNGSRAQPSQPGADETATGSRTGAAAA